MIKGNTKQTSAKAASAASKVLRNPKAGKTARSAVASALSQTPKRSDPPGVLPAGGTTTRPRIARRSPNT